MLQRIKITQKSNVQGTSQTIRQDISFQTTISSYYSNYLVQIVVITAIIHIFIVKIANLITIVWQNYYKIIIIIGNVNLHIETQFNCIQFIPLVHFPQHHSNKLIPKDNQDFIYVFIFFYTLFAILLLIYDIITLFVSFHLLGNFQDKIRTIMRTLMVNSQMRISCSFVFISIFNIMYRLLAASKYQQSDLQIFTFINFTRLNQLKNQLSFKMIQCGSCGQQLNGDWTLTQPQFNCAKVGVTGHTFSLGFTDIIQPFCHNCYLSNNPIFVQSLKNCFEITTQKIETDARAPLEKQNQQKNIKIKELEEIIKNLIAKFQQHSK